MITTDKLNIVLLYVDDYYSPPQFRDGGLAVGQIYRAIKHKTKAYDNLYQVLYEDNRKGDKLGVFLTTLDKEPFDDGDFRWRIREITADDIPDLHVEEDTYERLASWGKDFKENIAREVLIDAEEVMKGAFDDFMLGKPAEALKKDIREKIHNLDKLLDEPSTSTGDDIFGKVTDLISGDDKLSLGLIDLIELLYARANLGMVMQDDDKPNSSLLKSRKYGNVVFSDRLINLCTDYLEAPDYTTKLDIIGRMVELIILELNRLDEYGD